jgi:uncharacterized membrane protein YgcG
MKKILLTLMFSFAIAAPLALPSVGHAQSSPCNQQGANNGSTFVPLEPCSPLTPYENDTSSNLPTLFQAIYRICVGIAVVLTILQLTRAGIMYMGGDSITNKEQAKHLIQVSLLGLLLVLSPVIVFTLINPDILNFSLNLDGLRVDQGQQGTVTTPGSNPGSGGGGTSGGPGTGGGGGGGGF